MMALHINNNTDPNNCVYSTNYSGKQTTTKKMSQVLNELYCLVFLLGSHFQGDGANP